MSVTQADIDRVGSHIGPIIRRAREAKGLTQAALGHAAGYAGKSAVVTINRIERGLSLPRLVGLFRIAEALDVPPHQLLDASSKFAASATPPPKKA